VERRRGDDVRVPGGSIRRVHAPHSYIGMRGDAADEAMRFSNEIARFLSEHHKKCNARRADAWQNLRQQGDGP